MLGFSPQTDWEIKLNCNAEIAILLYCIEEYYLQKKIKPFVL